ncbi:MAG: hypothetical protein GF307_06745 [candidate division Zixibacteria bacterium]|nr:hypothetical protein [candidate division Zixibacteria bacterium]
MISRLSEIDSAFALMVLVLAIFGCLMVYSSSAHYCEQNIGDSFYYIKKQMMWLVISIIAGIAAYLAGYRRLLEWSPWLLLLSCVFLVAVLFSPPIRNVHRWIKLGPFNFQPSEMARIFLVLFFAFYLSLKRNELKGINAFLVLICVSTLIGGLIVIEPDIGTTLSMTAALGLMLYIAGIRAAYLMATGGAALTAVVVMIFGFGYQQDRIIHYINGLCDPLQSQYQVLQGIIAIGSGGFLGAGLGEGGQKLLFLPESYSDFVFANIAEETGLIGTIPLILMYAFLFKRGCTIARGSSSFAGSLVACGLTTLICASAFINMGVVAGILPVTGLPLPFISYGGSSMLFSMISVGIILSVAQESVSSSNSGILSRDRHNLRRRWYRRTHLSGARYRRPAYKRKR